MADNTRMPPSLEEIRESSNDLIEAGSELKQEFLKHRIRSEKMERYMLNDYLREANQYLQRWDDYSKTLQEQLRACPGNEHEDFSCIDFDLIRPYLYGDHDYASILPFTDGIFKGIRSGRFEDADDIHGFRDHTARTAFPESADSSAGLMDRVVNIYRTEEYHAVDKLSLQKYRGIRNNARIFNNNARREIYKAVQKSMEYILDHLEELNVDADTRSYSGMKMFVAAITDAIDYATYSMIVFGTRICCIYCYAQPFFHSSEKNYANTDAAPHFKESVQLLPSEHVDGPNTIHVMRDADDGILKSPERIRDLVDTMSAFVTQAGCVSKTNGFPTLANPHCVDADVESSVYCRELQNNWIYDFVTNTWAASGKLSYAHDATRFNEFSQFFRECMYDQRFALPDNSSPREEMLHVIRGLEPKSKTLESYRDHVYGLYIFLMKFGFSLRRLIDMIVEEEIREKNNPTSSAGTANDIAECLRIANYMYREFMLAIVYKARYLEAQINHLNNQEVQKLIGMSQLRIPGFQVPEPNISDHVTMAIPDTLKMPFELAGMYALPAFESMEMYDAILRSTPEFANDLYLSEKFDLSAIINLILSLIAGAQGRFKNFINDQSVRAAVEWTKRNGTTLQQMDFTGKSLNVLPYKDTIKFGDTAKNLINGINGLNPAQYKKEEDINRAILSLYPSEGVFNFFKEDAQDGARRYRNYLLFAENEQSATNQKQSAIVLTDKEISQKVIVWVKSVSAAKETFDAYTQLSNQLTSAVNSLKSKLVSITNQSQTTTTQETTTPAQGSSSNETASFDPPPTPGASAGEKKTDNTGAAQEQPKADKSDVSAAEVIGLMQQLETKVQLTVQRLWAPATDMFIEYIRAQYSYLKQAHGLGKSVYGSSQQTSNSETSST